MWYLKHFVFLLLLFKVVTSNCPLEWVQNGDRCYYISPSSVSVLAWHEAQSRCESMRSSLAIINDEAENTFLYTRFEKYGNYYIGLHDLSQEDAWQWVDGSPLTYAAWFPGQPDNGGSGKDYEEDCVEMVGNKGGLWSDMPCVMKRSYICERSVDIKSNPNCRERDGWEEYGGRCYKVIKNKLPWTAAETDCKRRSANLVAITSKAEQLYVSNEVNEWNQQLWIGLSSVDHNQLYWSNGFSKLGYTNWAPGQPVLNSSASNCVEIEPGASTNGLWNVTRCGEGHAYMCETAITGSCAEGWYWHNGKCYFQATTQQLWTSWVGAKDICEAMGATLLQIETAEEQKYINTRLQDILDGGSDSLWMGISDSDNDGTFVWVDGTPVASSSFINWGQNQPRNQDQAWDCGKVYAGSSYGKWETGDCFKKRAYFCEISTSKHVKPIDPTAETGKGCDPGWRYFQSSCYYFENTMESTWQEGRQQCQQYGGDLVSILSGKENAFVTGYAYGKNWIGANDVKYEGKFIWSDGSAWSFSDWQPDEPNNLNDADCTIMWAEVGYKWDATECSKKYSYICKKLSHGCDQPLGMEDGSILDGEITASSVWDVNHAPYLGRLDNGKLAASIGAWAPAWTPGEIYPHGSAWIQVHLIPERTVTGVTTQGRRQDFDEYVTTYQIAYSDDGASFTFISNGTHLMTFTGNVDSSTPVTNRFPSSIVTSYIRLYPIDYQRYPTLRMELLGCSSDGADLSTPAPNPECTAVAVHERLDCGYANISRTECLNKGCCWDNTIRNTKSCFYQKDKYDPRCGKDWSFDPGGKFLCYYFNDYQHKNWQQSREYCQAMGGDLLSVNSKSEQAYITAQTSSYLLSSGLWTGGNNLDPDSGWQWSNGQPFNFIQWANGEPNGYDSGENCIELQTYDGVWKDTACDAERGFACTKHANVAPPTVIDDGNSKIEICEGNTGHLVCTGNTMIVIHHASYGRSNNITCGGIAVPSGGCHSTDSLDIVSNACNYRNTCSLTAISNIYGDPCSGTYKFLNVIYSCEKRGCYIPLGVENGTVSDSQIYQSSYTDNNHQGADGRLNGNRSWATNEGVGAWVQVTFPSNKRITGFIVQGANDADRYVTLFKIQVANDNSFLQWTDYTDYDGNVVNFDGNSNTTTPMEVILTKHIFTAGVRILPLKWQGDMIGMRFEITGCNPLRELNCTELGDLLLPANDANGTVVQADCPGYCTQTVLPQPTVYGTNIYAGNSEICKAAVHAGVIIDRFGGPVTMIKKPAQTKYVGSVRNNVVSKDQDYYPVAFAFTNNEKNCQAGWIPYQSHCYWISDIALTWSESEAHCVNQGGHLASIFNSVDQDFVFQQLHLSNYTDIWIGLNGLRSVNEYEWIDGEPVTYTNWMRKEPNNYKGRSENCVEMYRDSENHHIGGKWNDASCTNATGFICKKFKSYYTEGEASNSTPAPGGINGYNSAAVIAGSVIGALIFIFLVIGIAIYCSRNNSSPGIQKFKEDVADIPTSFVNKLHDLVEDASPSATSRYENDYASVHFAK